MGYLKQTVRRLRYEETILQENLLPILFTKTHSGRNLNIVQGTYLILTFLLEFIAIFSKKCVKLKYSIFLEVLFFL
jgi:hypothetical protein